MNYHETIDFLFTRLPMFSKLGAAAYKKDLYNILELENAIGNPHKKFKSVHVAGTNGKGSTCHMMAAVLQEAGYKTGLYTSPHLKDFRERIRINGEMIPEQYVVDFTENMKPLIATIEPSFFELTVAMAYKWFADEKVDIAVIEVGLGGRLDSTNIISPEVSVITNIGYDHMNILGNTLTEIASEKAGIIKSGIPVVIGESFPETKAVFEAVANERKSPLFYAESLQLIINWKYKDHHLAVTLLEKGHTDGQEYTLDLMGAYQTRNLRTVIQAIRILQQKGWQLTESAIHKGLSSAKKLTGLRGRWEKIADNPAVILDVAHNEDGIKAILQQLEISTFTHLHIVIGLVKDKNFIKVLEILPRHAFYYFTQAPIPRALPAADLAKKAGDVGLKGKHFSEVNSALQAAKNAAGTRDLILVCGSVFVVGEVNR